MQGERQLKLTLDCEPPTALKPTRGVAKPRPMKPPPAEQPAINYDRASRRRLITDAPLSTHRIKEGNTIRRIPPDDQKNVLRAIDDHASECWGIGQIMKFTGMTKRDAWRTVKALNDQGLLATRKLTKRIQGVNRTFDAFAIVYSELEILTGTFRLVADVRACPPDIPRVPTEQSARAHLTSRPCPSGHTNRNGNRNSKPKGTGERERLIVLVSGSGVFLATEAVDAALARGITPQAIEGLAAGRKDKALYDALMAIQPLTQEQLQHRRSDKSKGDRESLIVGLRAQKIPPEEINRRLEAAGFEPVAISSLPATTINATKGP